MNRFLFRVRYDFADGTGTYEPVCVRSETETDARAQVMEATDRYAGITGATRTLTLVLTTDDV